MSEYALIYFVDDDVGNTAMFAGIGSKTLLKRH
jgi:hypothetical protein